MTDHTPTRSDEIKTIHHEYKFFYQVLGGSLLVAIGILIGAIAPCSLTMFVPQAFPSVTIGEKFCKFVNFTRPFCEKSEPGGT